MKDDTKKQREAEQFADRMEAKMRKLGSTADYFCAAQRERWRQHAIRAYLGLSPNVEKDAKTASSSEPDIIR